MKSQISLLKYYLEILNKRYAASNWSANMGDDTSLMLEKKIPKDASTRAHCTQCASRD